MTRTSGRRQELMEPADNSEALMSEAEAARLLFVSRTYLEGLLDDGKLPVARTTPDGHRLIPRAIVAAYRERMRLAQKEGLDRMVESSDQLGLYDDELDGLPVRRKE